MSGGAYNYLFTLENLPPATEVRRMYESAKKLDPEAPGTLALRDLTAILETGGILFGTVAMAMEWRDSGDWDDPTALSYLRSYPKKPEP